MLFCLSQGVYITRILLETKMGGPTGARDPPIIEELLLHASMLQDFISVHVIWSVSWSINYTSLIPMKVGVIYVRMLVMLTLYQTWWTVVKWGGTSAALFFREATKLCCGFYYLRTIITLFISLQTRKLGGSSSQIQEVLSEKLNLTISWAAWLDSLRWLIPAVPISETMFPLLCNHAIVVLI
jgi:hypothetical protein